MRTLTTLLCWLITTVMLAVTVPTAWVQYNLVDDDGFAALSQRAAQNPALQAVVAGELATQGVWPIRERGIPADDAQVRGVASAYTAGPEFPPRFARAMQGIHRSMFTDTGVDEWVVDLSPMLGDSVFNSAATDYVEAEPLTLAMPVPEALRAGPLRALGDWSRWISLGAVVLTGFCALLTLVAARRRGKALTGLGVSALLVGALGWAGVEVARGYLDEAVDNTAGAVHKIIDILVTTGVDSLHDWLNWTLAGGGVLVVLGVPVAVLGGLRKP